MTDTLPEISAADAPPEIKAIYDQIMTLTGVGSPALIYRHFAVFPGFLEWVWDVIGPELENGYLVREAPAAVRRMDSISLPALGKQDLADCGLSTSDMDLLAAMFATYNRMNPVNLGLITAIRMMIAGHVDQSKSAVPLPQTAPAEPATTMKLPAPVNLNDMDADLQAILLDISSTIPNTNGTVIPTLYRHLAIWPDLMRRIAPGLSTAIKSGDVDAKMEQAKDVMAPLTQEIIGRALARGLGPAPVPDPAKMVETLDSFLVTIPQLIVLALGLEKVVET